MRIAQSWEAEVAVSQDLKKKELDNNMKSVFAFFCGPSVHECLYAISPDRMEAPQGLRTSHISVCVCVCVCTMLYLTY